MAACRSAWRNRPIPILLALALAASACANLFGSYDVTPNGLNRHAHALRGLLTSAQYDSALVRVSAESDVAPHDELLRLLQQGIVARYAGRYEVSSAALERAIVLTDERFTKSISRSALSLLTSDLALPYVPGRAERALIHYYGALNYLAQGDVEGAAVEARRLSYLLEQYEDEESADGRGPTCGLAGGIRTCGVLRYFAGAVFEAAGQMNDATVAYRHAHAFDAVPPAAESAAVAAGSGEVLVLVERGFVAHRAEQALLVPILPLEVDAVSGGEAAERLAAAAVIAARVVEQVLRQTSTTYYGDDYRPAVRIDPPARPRVVRRCEKRDHPEPDTAGRGSSRKRAAGIPGVHAPDGASGTHQPPHRRACASPDENDNPYLLKIAWPVFRSESAPRSVPVVVGPSGEHVPVRLRADLSDAVIGDFERERRLVLARTIARAAAKFAVTRTVEKKIGDDGDVAPRVLGLLTNLTTALLERADTRSWHLLPADIGIARLRLPAGPQLLALRLGGDRGAPGRRIELKPVDVRAGGLTIVATRVWW